MSPKTRREKHKRMKQKVNHSRGAQNNIGLFFTIFMSKCLKEDLQDKPSENLVSLRNQAIASKDS